MYLKLPVKSVFLFLLFFLFQWGGQFTAAAAAGADGDRKLLFTALLYICFLTRGGIWLFVLRDIPLTWAFSLASLGYLVIPVLSYFILEEPFRPGYLPGGLLILGGVSLYGLARQRSGA